MNEQLTEEQRARLLAGPKVGVLWVPAHTYGVCVPVEHDVIP